VDESKLVVKGVGISYKAFSLSHISFNLNQGEILGLVGGSGSGKSTIIKALVGIKLPDSGSVKFTIKGKEMPLNDYLGYSPQQNSLFPFLTVEENIQTFAKLYKVDSYTAYNRMDALLKRLNLSNHRSKRINQLSGGMKKRVDLAVSLIHSPKFIILDEPFNGLDISLQKFIWDLLLELKEKGKMIIVSSHMLSDIRKYCSKFGLVHKGYFYNTEQIDESLKTSKHHSFESFLGNLFEKSMKN
jgi:ABC-type multidrug transport system ATPase subunit